MRFWDTSALLPLIVSEPHSPVVAHLLETDDAVAIWWGTAVECHSGLQRRLQDATLDLASWQRAVSHIDRLLDHCFEIQPTLGLRRNAQRMLAVHRLRAADALQLAAALTWAGGLPQGQGFVTFDQRLRTAAALEGFQTLP